MLFERGVLRAYFLYWYYRLHEPDLVALEVEVRLAREDAISVRIIALIHLCHQALSFTSRWKRNYMLSALNLI